VSDSSEESLTRSILRFTYVRESRRRRLRDHLIVVFIQSIAARTYQSVIKALTLRVLKCL